MCVLESTVISPGNERKEGREGRGGLAEEFGGEVKRRDFSILLPSAPFPLLMWWE